MRVCLFLSAVKIPSFFRQVMRPMSILHTTLSLFLNQTLHISAGLSSCPLHRDLFFMPLWPLPELLALPPPSRRPLSLRARHLYPPRFLRPFCIPRSFHSSLIGFFDFKPFWTSAKISAPPRFVGAYVRRLTRGPVGFESSSPPISFNVHFCTSPNTPSCWLISLLVLVLFAYLAGRYSKVMDSAHRNGCLS